ncbi:MAG: hypothetical protein ACOVLB_07925 [Candidatus Nanopelagicus sp.]
MIVTLDTVAERYGLLPSEVLTRSTTLDLYVMDAAISYHNYQSKKANKQLAETPSTEELLEMIKKVK